MAGVQCCGRRHGRGIRRPFLIGPSIGGRSPAPRLTRVGCDFRSADGAIWKVRGATAFTALYDWCQGQRDKLERYADATQAVGVNTWRVFAMWWTLGWGPAQQPDYYDQAAAFLAWTASRVLTAQMPIFCDQVDGSTVLLSRDAQDLHLIRMLEVFAAAPASHLPEIVNEDFKNGRLAARYDAALFARVLAARSSAPDDERPDAPGSFLDWTSHHTPRDAEWARKAKELLDIARLGFPGFTATNLPAIATEPIRIEDATPAECADYFALAELFGAGAIIHGGLKSRGHATDLQNCIWPQPGEPGAEHIAAIAEAWKSEIPAEAAGTWRYTRGGGEAGGGDDGECPIAHTDIDRDPAGGALRTFALIAPDGSRACAVLVGRGPQHTVTPRDGWRVERVTGHLGNVIHLVR